MRTRMLVVCSVLLTACVWGVGNAQDKMSKDEWQKEMQDYTRQRDDLKDQVASLDKDISDLKNQLASLERQVDETRDATWALVGATKEMIQEYEQKLSNLESTVNNLAAMSDADLYNHRKDVDQAQNEKDQLAKQKIAAIPQYQNRLQTIQDKLDGLKRTIAQAAIAPGHEKIYVVKTWAKDRDCLWNIAKKPSIYDNPFMWPHIYQANRDQIKDPNLIYPHERLKIPPAGAMASTMNHRSKRHAKNLAHRGQK